jgi:hypothetical protein
MSQAPGFRARELYPPINEHIELESAIDENSSALDSNVPRTITCEEPIRDNEEYSRAIRRERYLMMTILAIIVVFGPLVFRFCLGCRTDPDEAPTWGGQLDGFEIYIILALFSNMNGAIIRLLPVVCGGPATIESVKEMKLEGQVALCLVSPFCAEGDEMLLRNLLGRTCTLFHTVSSRHTLHGLYVDVTMNERRLKGEANRKKIFYEWMAFLTTLVKICQKNDTERKPFSPQGTQPSSTPATLSSCPPTVIANKYTEQESNTNFKNRFQSFRKYGETVFDMGRDVSVHDFAPDLVVDARNSIQLRTSMRRKSTIGSAHLFRKSTISQHQKSVSSSSDHHSGAGAPKASIGSSKAVSFDLPPDAVPAELYGDAAFSPPLSSDREMTHWTVLNGLEVNIETIEPVINFFDQWLAEMKLNERVYHYGDKKCVPPPSSPSSCSHSSLSLSESLDRLFLAAPFIDHFFGEDLLAVHTALDRLYVAFTTTVPDDADPKLPLFPDDFQEVEWKVTRKNSPDWTVVWSLLGRSKLRPMSQEEIGDLTSPAPLFDVVQIVPGAIVYCKSRLGFPPSHAIESLLAER